MKQLVLSLAIVSMANCSNSSTEPIASEESPAAQTTDIALSSVDSAGLTGYHWILSNAVDAGGNRIDKLFVRTDKPVQMDFTGNRINVHNTCNLMTGSYVLEEGRFIITRLSSTRKLCADAALVALDAEFGARIEGSHAVALQATGRRTLTLTNAKGDTLAFNGQPTAETYFGGPGERIFLEVAALTKPCNHPLTPDKQCLQIREIRYNEKGLKAGEPGEWRTLYDDIEGYTHEQGMRNVLRLKRFKRTQTPADASSTVYVLDMIVESEISSP